MSSLTNLIRTVAPTLASAMGGPLAGMATNFILQHFGDDKLPEGVKPEACIEELLRQPGNFEKMQELDLQFKQKMQQLNVDVFALEVEDRKSARELGGKHIWVQAAVSVAFLVAYFGILVWVFWAEISPAVQPGMYLSNGKFVEQPESLMNVFQVLLGVLTAGVAQILNFWFGGAFNKQSNR